jgi:transposase
MLHHDNASCHTAISVNECLAKKGISVVPQPPYSPDLSPCDFFLFPKLKFHLKGRHLGTVDNIQKVVTDQLRALPALIERVGATSPAVCGFRRELL